MRTCRLTPTRTSALLGGYTERPMSHYSLKIDMHDGAARQAVQQKLTQAADFVMQKGYLYVEDAISGEKADELNAAILGGLKFTDDGSAIVGSYRTGPGRYAVPVRVDGQLVDFSVFCPPILGSLMSMVLGPDFILNSLSAVVSLPGAPAQDIHLDYPPIYDRFPFVAASLPPYAITVGIPLVDITMENGPTTVFSGSHRLRFESRRPLPNSDRNDPQRKGAAVLWDYRTWHGGCANHSSEPRALLVLVFSTPWFRDPNFFSKDVPPIMMDEEVYRSFNDEHRRIFPPGLFGK
jgi:hypothetical protein